MNREYIMTASVFSFFNSQINYISEPEHITFERKEMVTKGPLSCVSLSAGIWLALLENFDFIYHECHRFSTHSIKNNCRYSLYTKVLL